MIFIPDGIRTYKELQAAAKACGYVVERDIDILARSGTRVPRGYYVLLLESSGFEFGWSRYAGRIVDAIDLINADIQVRARKVTLGDLLHEKAN